MARDENMYGADSTAMAQKIAADALDPAAGMAGSNESDYWGKTIDDTAVAKGNVEKYDTDPKVSILRKAAAGGGDHESLNDSTKGGQRHRPGPGGGV